MHRDDLCNMLIRITIETSFFSCNVTGFHCANTNLGFTGHLASFSLFAGLQIGLFHSVHVLTILCYRILQNISNTSNRELSLVTWKFLFIPKTPENARF